MTTVTKTENEVDAYEVERNKDLGTVDVKIWNNGISTQRADLIARSMFAVPVRLTGKTSNAAEVMTVNRLDVRSYTAIGWNDPTVPTGKRSAR